MREKYSYVDDPGLLIASDRKDYEELVYNLRQGLASQSPTGEERLTLEEWRNNDEAIQMEVTLHREDDLGIVYRYRIEEEDRSVYIFDHHSGSLILGDGAMTATASERISPEMLSPKMLESSSPNI